MYGKSRYVELELKRRLTEDPEARLLVGNLDGYHTAKLDADGELVYTKLPEAPNPVIIYDDPAWYDEEPNMVIWEEALSLQRQEE